MSTLKNNFDEEDKALLFEYFPYCWQCNSTKFVSLHHIFKRKSKSILNAHALCGICHENVTHSDEEHKKFIFDTFQKVCYIYFGIERYGKAYEFKERDNEFILDYQECFDFLLVTSSQVET